MEYFFYIIRNKKTGILYKGQTNNLNRRLHEHELDRWYGGELIFVQICNTRSESMKLEKFFKTGVGREIIQKFLVPT